MAEHAWENHHPINWEETSVLDRVRGELLLKEALYIQMTPAALQLGQRTENPGLLDCIDEETGREEQSSLTFDIQDTSVV